MYKSSRLPLSGSGGGLAQSDSALAGIPGIGGSNPAPAILLFRMKSLSSKRVRRKVIRVRILGAIRAGDEVGLAHVWILGAIRAGDEVGLAR